MQTLHRLFSRTLPTAGAVLLLAVQGSPALAQAPWGSEELGSVDFQVSCDAGVQDDFDRAVALLHHMMYQEARGTFEAIAAQDPGCAMAHWGVAQTLFQPLWPARPTAEDRTRAWERIQRAGELGPGTDRERHLLAAAEAFFQNPQEDEWWPRIERWSQAMETAYRERPHDDEIAALYGLSLLARGAGSEDQLAHNAQAAEVLTEVHQRDPLHPGAIHYIIHADDASGRAHQHLDVVETYGEIAPHVPHALHMPSHIYVRLGDWPEVIEWNRASADAALEFSPEEWISMHHIHGLDYLLYAYLQQGHDQKAVEVLQEGLAREPYQEDFGSAFHLAIMPARYAVERRAWEEAADLEPGEPGYLAWERYLWPEAVTWFARGLGALHTGDLQDARASETRMVELRDGAHEAGERAFATYIDVDRLILSGWIAHAEGDANEAVRRVERATELEATVEKHPITPGALLPPYEALGNLLMELNRPGEALEAYEASLDIWPGRYNSVLGAARAAAELGEAARATEHYRSLLTLVDEGASDRAGVREAWNVLGASP